MKRTTNQEYDWMEGCKHRNKRRVSALKPDFLRKPYQGTKAEPKDNTQEQMHDKDWLL